MPEISIPQFEKVTVAPPSLDFGGPYTFNIQEKPTLEQTQDGKQYISVKVVCLDGPTQKEADPMSGSNSPVGRKWGFRLYLVDGAYFKIKALLISSGILKRDDTSSAVAMGRINTDILMGAKFRANINPNYDEKSGNTYRDVQFLM